MQHNADEKGENLTQQTLEKPLPDAPEQQELDLPPPNLVQPRRESHASKFVPIPGAQPVIPVAPTSASASWSEGFTSAASQSVRASGLFSFPAFLSFRNEVDPLDLNTPVPLPRDPEAPAHPSNIEYITIETTSATPSASAASVPTYTSIPAASNSSSTAVHQPTPGPAGSFFPYVTSISDAITTALSDQIISFGPTRNVTFAVPSTPVESGSGDPSLLAGQAGISDPSQPQQPQFIPARSSSMIQDQGVVEVVSRRQSTVVDPDLEALRRIPQFEPLLSSSISQSTFNWGGLFTSASGGKPDLPESIDPTPAIQLWESCRAHIQRCADVVARDQDALAKNISNIDEYSAKLANTVTNRVIEAKTQCDKLANVANIRKQAEKTEAILEDILLALDKLGPLIPSEDRLSSLESEERYPALSKYFSARGRNDPVG
ncbi:hypothetical protein DFS34DRAFT_258663 [Phlyctochytrium arcticum]|nr:hypothetical protein DFS34DRAFT_258663 [Phlyctochytrium arcticum]